MVNSNCRSLLTKSPAWIQNRSGDHRWLQAGVLLCAVLHTMVLSADEENSRALSFERNVVPILQRHCLKCHGEEDRQGNLDLRRRFSMVTGGDSGPALVPKDPAGSLLIQYIEDGLMPPKQQPPVSESDLQLLTAWISAGAVTADASEPPLPDSPSTALTARDADMHWAFQPVTAPPIPEVNNSAWIQTPVDAFILSRLEQQRLLPAEPASRRTLLRRLYFDVIGLPPTPEEIAAFVNDPDPAAWERQIDRLLADNRYGERWAQHWLDVVRFAESEGYEYDRHLPEAWRYRDYVIDALNADMSYQQFVSEQLAGDEMQPEDPRLITATIFHRLGAVRRNAGNPEIALSRNEVLTERTNIVGEAFLALTVGCARCHNHKLEPITQRDYYQLQAYLAATQEHNLSLVSRQQQQTWQEQADAATKQIKQLKAKLASSTADEQQTLREQIRALQQQLQPLPTVPGIRNDPAKRTAIHVLRRGQWEHKGAAVGPRPPSVLVSADVSELAPDVSNPRTQLARWITSSETPLTARVIVNRIWQYHFGAGLVQTPNDFGMSADPPSHPQLLDWLTHSFIVNGWKWKPLHRMILLSSAWQMSTLSDPDHPAVQADPENRLLARFSRRRLSGEELRDAMLAISGRLNPKQHGPGVMLPVDEELTELLYDPNQWMTADDPTEGDRRSIYLFAKRNLRLPFMEVFDGPTSQSSCPVRGSSTHAPQALELLNGKLTNDLAASFADRLQQECGSDTKAVVNRAWQLATGRTPTSEELKLCQQFLRDAPLQEFALAVFNLNEFLYVR